MKKTLALILALLMVFALAACGGQKAPEAPAQEAAETEAPAKEAAETEAPAQEAAAEETETTEEEHKNPLQNAENSGIPD